MEIAGIQIGTAHVALVVAVGVAFWNLVRYLHEGGRVRVEMRPAILTTSGTLFQGRRAGWKPSDNPADHEKHRVELAAFSIENVGRTAVTISEFSFDFGRPHPFSRHRYTVSMHQVPYQDWTTDTRVRLEPFDQCRVLLEVMPPIGAARREYSGRRWPRRTLRVRASVRVAGKRLRRRSRWRHGWRIRPDQRSLVPGRTPSTSEMVYTAVWRYLHANEDTAAYIARATYELEKLYDDDKQPELREITATLDQVFDQDQDMIGYSMAIVLELARTMRRKSAPPGDPPPAE